MRAPSWTFGVLGPLDVRVDGVSVPVRGAAARLLAVLLTTPGRVRSIDGIIEALWGAAPPAGPIRAVRSHATRLRAALGGRGAALLVTRPPGYVLDVAADTIDAHRFTSAVRAAERIPDRQTAAAEFRRAERLWRGPAYADVDGVAALAAERTRLDEVRLTAVEARLAVDVDLGEPVVDELHTLLTQHPLRERLWLQLMRAYERAGRRIDALGAFRQARRVLVERAGVEPGPALRRLQTELLEAERAAAVPVPRSLPAPPRHFVGRVGHTARAAAVLQPRTGERRPRIVAITGPGGAGKSALAITVAHRIADRYSDGQLYVDLHGWTAGLPPKSTAETVAELLPALGVRPENVPVQPGAALALLRRVTSRRRLLLVVDNTADPAQVLELIPSGPASAVIVTGRRPMPALGADATIRIGALPRNEATRLLGLLTAGVAMTDEQRRTIAGLCGHLALAVQIAAGRLNHRPDLGADSLVRRLSSPDEPEPDGSAAWSAVLAGIEALGAGQDGDAARRVLDAVGALRLPAFDVAGLAAVLKCPRQRIRAACAALVARHLLDGAGDDTYTVHDLVRLAAAERFAAHGTTADRDAMLLQLAAFYRDAVGRLGRQLNPAASAGRELDPGRLAAIDTGPDIHAPDLDWLRLQQGNILALARQLSTVPHADPTFALDLTQAWQRNSAFVRLSPGAAHRLAGIALATARGPQDRSRALSTLARTESQLHLTADAEAHLAEARRLLDDEHEPIEVYRVFMTVVDGAVDRGELGKALAALDTVRDLVAAHPVLHDRRTDVLRQRAAVLSRLGRSDEATNEATDEATDEGADEGADEARAALEAAPVDAGRAEPGMGQPTGQTAGTHG